MRLALKLSLFFTLGAILVFGVRAFQGVGRERRAAEQATIENQKVIGVTLRTWLLRHWAESTRERAPFFDDLRLMHGTFDVRWLPAAEAPLSLPPEGASRVDEAQGRLVTLVPVTAEGRPIGAIEVSGELLHSDQQLAVAIQRVLVNAALAALASIVIGIGVGVILIGRPMRRLAEKAQRIGAGDFSPQDQGITSHDEIGQLSRAMDHMCRDLQSARQMLAAETSRRIAALEQLRHTERLAVVGQLAAGVAHELGTPLNVVLGRVEMIATGEAQGDKIQACARSINDQVERMTKIIRQLLDFSRPGTLQTGDHDLMALAKKTGSLLQPLAKKSGVVFEFVGPPVGDALKASVDARQIEQVITNVAMNGIQAMPGGGRLTVEVSSRRVRPPSEPEGSTRDHVCVAIRDEGVGISAEHLSHIFEPFFSTKGVGEGTGLGLSVTYGIVREHGGWIDVESKPGRGSTFSIYLPISRSHLDPDLNVA